MNIILMDKAMDDMEAIYGFLMAASNPKQKLLLTRLWNQLSV